MRAVVLSGGGSKGAYQVGVWKALKKLNIKYDIVTGTSVGALNAALMTQKTYLKAVKLWKNIEFDKVIDEKIDEHNIIKSYAENIVHGGMNTTNLEQTIDETLNLKKIYNSKIDMGIITVRLNKLRPITLTKKEIEPSKLKDYLIASASCFPAFKTKVLENDKYIDGGYFDNLPINLAIKMGADEIIAVDLKEVGLKRKVEDKNVKITTISPRNDIGSFLVFEKNISRRAIKFGYNDTLKEFKKLDGNKFTFKKNNLIYNYEKYSYNFDKLSHKNISFKEFNEIIEKLGFLFKIDDSLIYDIKKYNKILINKFKNLDDDKNIVKLLKENKIKKLFSNEYMVKYMYKLIDKRQLKELHLVFKTEYLCAIYMKVIMEDLCAN